MLGHLSAALGPSGLLRCAIETGAAKQAIGNAARIKTEMIRTRKLDLAIMLPSLARRRRKVAEHRRSLAAEAAASAAHRRLSRCAAGCIRENALFRLLCLNLINHNPYALRDKLQVNNTYSDVSGRFCNAASSAIGSLHPISDDAELDTMLQFLLISIFKIVGIAIRIPTQSRKVAPNNKEQRS